MASYWHTPHKAPYEWTTLPKMLQKWSEKTPQTQAYVVRQANAQPQAITFRQLYVKSQLIGKNLIRLGFKKGDFVLITGMTSIGWILCDFACSSIGVATIRCGAQVLTLDGLVNIANRNKVKAIFFHPGKDDEFENHSLHKCFPSAFHTQDDKTSVSEEVPSLQFLIRMVETRIDNMLCMKDLLSEDTIGDIELPRLDPSDIMTVFLTSGSMGFPKAVPRTHFAGINRYLHSNITQNLKEGDRFFTARSLAWLGSRIYYPVCFGSTNIYGQPIAKGDTETIEFLLQVNSTLHFQE